MNITFLIGNGFDVGVGTKSRFKDFFPIYREKSKNKPETIKQLSNEIEGNYETWADFEKALGEYTVNFTPETKQNFLNQIRDFEKEFIDYLKEQENGLSFEGKDELSTVMIDALTKYFSLSNIAPESSSAIATIYSNHSDENHVYNFVNFNYTDTLKNCLDTISKKVVTNRKYRDTNKIDKIGEIIHVHGQKYAHPIIGVNDISQIANTDLSKDKRFVKMIVKPSLNERLRLGNDKKATDIINRSTIICIYGMSLGITDKKWWSLVLSWLKGNSGRHLVIFDYDTNYSASTQFDWPEKEDKIVDTLSQYSNAADVENLIPRIHIAIHRNIFEIDLRKEVVHTRRIEKIKETAMIAAEEVRVANEEARIGKAVAEVLERAKV